MTDAELNEAVAREVMGWRSRYKFNPPTEPYPYYQIDAVDQELRLCRSVGEGVRGWSPATNIADAMEVVEKMRADGYRVNLYMPTNDSGKIPHCYIGSKTGIWNAKHNNPARAICEAALEAVRSKNESRS